MAHSLTLVEALVLGAVQGLTEFLPISSDGHLALGAFLFGIREMSLATVVFLHIGTLVATCWVFRADVRALLAATWRAMRAPSQLTTTAEGRLWSRIVIASVPTAVMGLFLEPRVESLAHSRLAVGAGFLVSGAALLVSLRPAGVRQELAAWEAIAIGVAQGLAVLPGVSRSGSTIALALALGLAPPAAFRFSFLLSLPAVGGAVLLKARDFGGHGVDAHAVVGAFVALFVGYAALLGLREAVSRGRLWVFSAYLFPLGVATVAWEFLR